MKIYLEDENISFLQAFVNIYQKSVRASALTLYLSKQQGLPFRSHKA
jgi:hypothetical protein